MTEDNQMTMALKSLRAKMVSPMQRQVVTELFESWITRSRVHGLLPGLPVTSATLT